MDMTTEAISLPKPVRKITRKRPKRRRKIISRERKKQRRKNMSPTRLSLVRERESLKRRTKTLTVEQLDKRREKNRIHTRIKRGNMSNDERIVCRERDRIRQQLRRGQMTNDKRDAERERDRIRKRLKRSAEEGVFSFGTKGSDLWRMKLNSWTLDEIENQWTLPSYTNMSEIMQAFCAVNVQQEQDTSVGSAPEHDPLSISSDEGDEEVTDDFDDWENSDYITADNIGVKVFEVNSLDDNNTEEQTDNCEVDLITPEVILTTDSET